MGTAASSRRVGAAAGELTGDWWRPLRRLDDVDVVYVDLSPNAANEQRALTWLDAGERHRADRFRHDGAKRRYILCRAAARSLLCSALGCANRQLAFGASEHGKPFATLAGAKTAVGFSVSHSGRHGLIALARRSQVGVDVEAPVAPRNLDILIEAVLSANERAEVTAASGAARLRLFLDLWTMKEALSKAHGAGLSMDVSGFEIPADMRRGACSGVCRLPNSAGATWQLANIGTDQFAAAVAYRAGTPGSSVCQAASGAKAPE